MHLSISRPIKDTDYLVVLHPGKNIVVVWQGMRIIETKKVKPYYEGQFEIIYNEYKKQFN
jgi:hypothetical protein